jgi:hypothetical protein
MIVRVPGVSFAPVPVKLTIGWIMYIMFLRFVQNHLLTAVPRGTPSDGGKMPSPMTDSFLKRILVSTTAFLVFMILMAHAATADAPLPGGAPPNDKPQASGVAVESSACPSDMRLIAGAYCRKVEQLCLHGSRLVDTGKTYTVAGVTRPIVTGKEYWCKNGCVPEPMDVCYEFVPNHSPCVSTKKVKGADDSVTAVVDEEPMRFCMDTFEWPNRVGELPRVMVSWFEAKKLCEGQGKRLCDDTEWTLACEGPDRLPYPYGWSRDDTLCNIDRQYLAWNAKRLFSNDPAVASAELARLSQREPIGQRRTCVSPFGVYDLTGNVDEWTRNVTGKDYPHASAFKGGHWVRGIRNRCRPKTSSHGPEFAFYAEGFRCCADAKPDCGVE